MSFFITPTRRFFLFRACAMFVLALVMGSLPLLYQTDTFGIAFALGLSAFCLALGLLNLWWMRRTSPIETITRIPQLAAPSERVRWARRRLRITAVAFAVMTVWVSYNLYQLESGAVKQIELWEPLIPIYTNLGFWPTVLSVPLVGVICCTVFFRLGRRLETQEVGRDLDGSGPKLVG